MAVHHIKYVYQPYPKMVTAPDGTRIRVATEDEHDELVSRWESARERDALLGRAAALGIKVDGRWSDKRLAEEIEAVQ